MTKQEAIRTLATRFVVKAIVTGVDYDSAGSATYYGPDPKDLEILSEITGRTVTEADLLFLCGDLHGLEKYHLRASLIQEINECAL